MTTTTTTRPIIIPVHFFSSSIALFTPVSILTFTLLLLLAAQPAQATYYQPASGTDYKCGYLDGSGTSALYNASSNTSNANAPGMCLTPSPLGYYFVTDVGNQLIRNTTCIGVPQATCKSATWLGQLGMPGSSSTCSATNPAATKFNLPRGLVLDTSANILYIANLGICQIWKISTNTKFCTVFVGSGACSNTPVDGVGTAATFKSPFALALSLNYVYVVDNLMNNVRRIAPDGTVLTIAGSLTGAAGYLNAVGTAALFNNPRGIAVSITGTVYIADYANQLIRQIDVYGNVADTAGMAGVRGVPGAIGNNYFNRGAGNNGIRFSGPCSLVFVGPAYLYVLDCDGQETSFLDLSVSPAIQHGFMLPQSGTLYTAVGLYPGTNILPALSCISSRYDGSYLAATIGCAIGEYEGQTVPPPAPNCIAGDCSNDACTFATGGIGGAITQARMSSANGSCSYGYKASDDVVYVADFGNNRIRQYNSVTLSIIEFAGTGTNNDVCTGTTAPAATSFSHPSSVAVDSAENLYITNYGSCTVVKLTASSGYTCSTIAGQAGSCTYVDQAIGASARFDTPIALTLLGNMIYVVEHLACRVRRINPSGFVALVAGFNGLVRTCGYQDGPGPSALFSLPTAITNDGTNLYIADTLNNRIRAIDVTTYVSTVAGQSAPGLVDAVGYLAQFNQPHGIGYLNGILWVTDASGDIRMVSPTTFDVKTYYILTDYTWLGPVYGLCINPSGNSIAFLQGCTLNNITLPVGSIPTQPNSGNPTDCGYMNGTGSAARFDTPYQLACNGSGYALVADSGNHVIRQVVGSTGVVTTKFGVAGTIGSTCAPGATTTFDIPRAVIQSAAGVIYVGNSGTCLIYAINQQLQCNLLNTGTCGTPRTGTASVGVTFRDVLGFSFDNTDQILYVADDIAHQIVHINTVGNAVLVAGKDLMPGYVDGAVTVAKFNTPSGTAVIRNNVYCTTGTAANTPSQTGAIDLFIYVADTGNNVIRVIYPTTGMVSTVVGSPTGAAGSQVGTGTNALLQSPLNLDFSYTYILYVTESQGNRIDIVDTTHCTLTHYTTTAETARGVCVDTFNAAINSNTTVYLTSGCEIDTVKAIDYNSSTPMPPPPGPGNPSPTPMPSVAPVIAGNQTCDYCQDAFKLPGGIIYLPNGSIVVADSGNNLIRTVNATNGAISNYSGTGVAGAVCTNVSSKTQYNNPRGVATDTSGNLYVTNQGSCVIYRIAFAGRGCSVVAGVANLCTTFSQGTGTGAQFQSPTGLTITPDDSTLFVTDSVANVVVSIVIATGAVTTIAGRPGYSCATDGPALTVACFNTPMAVAYTASASQICTATAGIYLPIFLTQVIYVADFGNNLVRAIYLFSGINWVFTVAGNGIGAEIDGIGSTASFNGPIAMALFGSNGLFVVDYAGQSVRSVDITTCVVGTYANLPNPCAGVAINNITNFIIFIVGNTIRTPPGLTPIPATPVPATPVPIGNQITPSPVTITPAPFTPDTPTPGVLGTPPAPGAPPPGPPTSNTGVIIGIVVGTVGAAALAAAGLVAFLLIAPKTAYALVPEATAFESAPIYAQPPAGPATTFFAPPPDVVDVVPPPIVNQLAPAQIFYQPPATVVTDAADVVTVAPPAEFFSMPPEIITTQAPPITVFDAATPVFVAAPKQFVTEPGDLVTITPPPEYVSMPPEIEYVAPPPTIINDPPQIIRVPSPKRVIELPREIVTVQAPPQYVKVPGPVVTVNPPAEIITHPADLVVSNPAPLVQTMPPEVISIPSAPIMQTTYAAPAVDYAQPSAVATYAPQQIVMTQQPAMMEFVELPREVQQPTTNLTTTVKVHRPPHV